MTGRSDDDYPSADERFAGALEEVIAKIENGTFTKDGTPYYRHEVDVAALRLRHGLTQSQFADLIGIAVGTIRNWEQGRRIPDGPAQRLLEVFEAYPGVFADMVAGEKTEPERQIEKLQSATEEMQRLLQGMRAQPELMREILGAAEPVSGMAEPAARFKGKPRG